MTVRNTHGIVETLDELAYLDGCRPQTAHCVLVTGDGGVEASDGALYCRRCCWDVRGSPVIVMMEYEDDACHCDGCGCLLAYTLNAEAACRSARLLGDGPYDLRCDDRYHVARMIEACPDATVLDVAIRAIGDAHGV